MSSKCMKSKCFNKTDFNVLIEQTNKQKIIANSILNRMKCLNVGY